MNFPMNRATGKPLPPLTLRGVLWSWIKGRGAALWSILRGDRMAEFLFKVALVVAAFGLVLGLYLIFMLFRMGMY